MNLSVGICVYREFNVIEGVYNMTSLWNCNIDSESIFNLLRVCGRTLGEDYILLMKYVLLNGLEVYGN